MGGKIMKLQKRWLSLLIAVVLVLCCTPALAASKFVVKDGIAVKYVDTGTDVVTAAMFEAEGVTAIGASCFKGTNVTSVTIPDSVVSIQDEAFSDCTKLTTVQLPSKITAIPDSCFDNASSLTGISIPSGVTSIGANAFRNCLSMKSAEGTETVKNKNLDDYKPIPGSVTAVADGAFANCPELVVSCFKGSVVETYAIKNTIKYESLDPVIDKITIDKAEYTLVYTKGAATTFTIPCKIEPEVAASSEVAWSSSDESLAEVSQKGVVTVKGTGIVTVTVVSKDIKAAMTSVKLVILDSSKGWQQVPASGPWYYSKAAGTYAVGKVQIDEKWYFFNELGQLQTGGWIKNDKVWYYAEASGELRTGWQEIPAGSGTWYHLGSEGTMQTGWLKDGYDTYYLDPDSGVMATGVRIIEKIPYRFRSSGKLMSPGWFYESEKWYFLDDTYTEVKGWKQDNGKWYYLSPSDGAMLTGWQLLGGSWYYLDTNSGAMLTGWQYIGGSWYYLNADGRMATGWLKNNGSWYYLNANGAMVVGWAQVGGIWYYFGSSGAMVTGWQTIGDAKYYFNAEGAMATGWLKLGGDQYYFSASGAMSVGWTQIGSDWYYFKNGKMITGILFLEGTKYVFNANGVWIP